jgi:hypothetical protein
VNVRTIKTAMKKTQAHQQPPNSSCHTLLAQT